MLGFRVRAVVYGGSLGILRGGWMGLLNDECIGIDRDK